MQVDEETNVDLNLFSSVAAIAERMLYPQFVCVFYMFSPPITSSFRIGVQCVYGCVYECLCSANTIWLEFHVSGGENTIKKLMVAGDRTQDPRIARPAS